MSLLPLDVCREIFLRSSAESLIRFRAVCKWWRDTIDDSCFVKTHTEQQQQLPSTTILIRNETGHPFHPLYSIDLQTLDFTDGLQSLPAAPLNISRDGLSRIPELPAAACNGLMLIPPSDKESNWEIWNILTHERLQLPRRDYVVSFRANALGANGLGYDSATHDYKAVVIARQESEPPVYHTHVYSLRSDEWTEIANFPCFDWRIACDVGVFFGGALYWITWQGIVALDMKTESYRQLDMPPLRDTYDRFYDKLSNRELCIYELSGCLMVSDTGNDDGYDQHFDLWVMKDNGTWMNLIALSRGFTSDPEFWLRPVSYMKKKMQVFLQDCERLYLFDIESNSRMTVSINGLSSEKVETQAFQGSIFRLHDNCGRINGGGSFSKEIGIKMIDIDTELIFCVRDDGYMSNSHYDCFSLDSNCYYLSTEEEEEEEEEEDMDED